MATSKRRAARTAKGGSSNRLLAGGLIAVALIVVAALAIVLGGGASKGTVVRGTGSSWTNISSNQLADALKTKDFTLLDVKTPYIGEIDGTDLYIPYDQLASRVSELPADRTAPIVVYCRSGTESAIAAQTLLDLGYRNVRNLDGGMNAWQASGRKIVQKPRT